MLATSFKIGNILDNEASDQKSVHVKTLILYRNGSFRFKFMTLIMRS